MNLQKAAIRSQNGRQDLDRVIRREFAGRAIQATLADGSIVTSRIESASNAGFNGFQVTFRDANHTMRVASATKVELI